MKRVIYQVVFHQNGYSCVDYETENIDQAFEVMTEMTAQAQAMGERDFCYSIKEKEVER